MRVLATEPTACAGKAGPLTAHAATLRAPFALDLITEESSFKSLLVWAWDKLHTQCFRRVTGERCKVVVRQRAAGRGSRVLDREGG